MDDSLIESSYQPKVKNLVVAYEQQNSEAVEDSYSYLRPRSKSIGNVLTYKHFRQSKLEIHNMIDIEKELVKIDTHLNYYEVYDKDTHVAFQEQLFEILRAIVSINTDDNSATKRRELIEETQKLAKILNAKLPIDYNSQLPTLYNGKKAYNNKVNEPEVISSTSISSQSKPLPKFKNSNNVSSTYSAEPLYNTANSTLIAQDTPTKPIKLSRFFSFNKEAKPNRVIIPAAYSPSLNRAISLNHKNNYKYTLYKQYSRENNAGFIQHETNYGMSKLNADQNTNICSVELYQEPLKEELENLKSDGALSVSVSDLKHFFEEKHQHDAGEDEIIRKKKQLNKTFSYSKHDYLALGDLNNNYLNEMVHNDVPSKFEEVHIANETPLVQSNIIKDDDVKDNDAEELRYNNTYEEEKELIESVAGQVKTLRKTFENINSSSENIKYASRDRHVVLENGEIPAESCSVIKKPTSSENISELSNIEEPTIDNFNDVQQRSGEGKTKQNNLQQEERQIDRDIPLKEPVQLQISNYLSGINNIDDGNKMETELSKHTDKSAEDLCTLKAAIQPKFEQSKCELSPAELDNAAAKMDATEEETNLSKETIDTVDIGNEYSRKVNGDEARETLPTLKTSVEPKFYESASVLSPVGLDNAIIETNDSKKCLLRAAIQPKSIDASTVSVEEKVKTPINKGAKIDQDVNNDSSVLDNMTPLSQKIYNSILNKSEENLLEKIEPEAGLDYYTDQFEAIAGECDMENVSIDFENMLKKI